MITWSFQTASGIFMKKLKSLIRQSIILNNNNNNNNNNKIMKIK